MTPYVKRLAALCCVLLAGCAGTAPRPAAPAKASIAALPAPAAAGDDKLAQADERFQAALKLMKDGQPQQAQAAFAALAREQPQFSGPLTDLGILYAHSRQRGQALASLTGAVGANPDNAVALNWLGILYRENGDFARAEQCYRKALELRPDYAAAHLNLAILYDLSLRRAQEALAQYRAYQQYSARQNPMVNVWIKELEAAAGAAVTVGAAP